MQRLCNPNSNATKSTKCIENPIKDFIYPKIGENEDAFWQEGSMTNDEDLKIEYEFNYSVTIDFATEMSQIGFYPDTKTMKSQFRYDYMVQEYYIMHQIWLVNYLDEESKEMGWGFSRWMEYKLYIMTYFELRPAYTNKTKVICKEIKTHECENCFVTVQHTGIIEFVEEKNRTTG